MRVDAALIEQALATAGERGRHTPPERWSRLKARTRRREIVVSVEDYGPRHVAR